MGKGKKYIEINQKVDKTKTYTVDEALDLICDIPLP